MDDDRLLLVDAGNSRLKAGWHRRGAPDAVRAEDADLRELLAGAVRVVACVAGEPAADGLRRAAGTVPVAVLGAELPAPDRGQYRTCGLDRVCAGIAAVAVHGACIVVDAGTATTLTAWREEGGRARFAGGLIAPGEVACLAGLRALAPALPAVDPADGVPAADQFETAGAIAAAAAIGHPALCAACLRALAAAAGLERTVLTGGSAARIAQACAPAQPEVDLVLRGLARLVEDIDA